MAHLITGYAGQEHIKSADQGSFNASFFGTGQYVMNAGNKFEATIQDNNTVRISDGDMLMYGRHIRIEPNSYEDLEIQTGTAGKNRCDLIVMQYEKDLNSGVEIAFLNVIQGTETEGEAVVPEYTDASILEGATMNQMPLYKVNIQGVVLSSVVSMFEVISTFAETAAEFSEEFAALTAQYKQEFIELTEQYEQEFIEHTANKADSANPVLTGSISLGRKANTTVGTNSFAVGIDVEASGNKSHAEGRETTASGSYSHAEGDHTTASGYESHAEGYGTTASGQDSHAEGRFTTAIGMISHAEGDHTTARSDYSHVEGRYNIEDTENKYAHIIGNGTNNTDHSNAFTVDWQGKVEAQGDIVANKDSANPISMSALNSGLAQLGQTWNLLVYTNSTTQVNVPVDLTGYKFVAFCMTYFEHFVAQIILPVWMVSSIRLLSALIDSPNNPAIITFNGSTETNIAVRVLYQVNNGIHAHVYGIK